MSLYSLGLLFLFYLLLLLRLLLLRWRKYQGVAQSVRIHRATKYRALHEFSFHATRLYICPHDSSYRDMRRRRRRSRRAYSRRPLLLLCAVLCALGINGGGALLHTTTPKLCARERARIPTLVYARRLLLLLLCIYESGEISLFLRGRRREHTGEKVDCLWTEVSWLMLRASLSLSLGYLRP